MSIYSIIACSGLLIVMATDDTIEQYMKSVWEKNKIKTLNDLAMHAFWNGSYTYTFIKYHCGKLYSTVPLIRSFVDALNESRKPIVYYPCASITRLIEYESGEFSILEDKFDLLDYEWKYKTIPENFLKLRHMCVDLVKNDYRVIECLLLIAENENCIYSRVINRRNMYKADKLSVPATMAKSAFLLVDYAHSEQSDSYELVVDNAYFIEGNHILSGSFVGRLLSKQGYTGVFDNKYKIVVMDKDINTVEWSFVDYVEVGANMSYALKLYDDPAMQTPYDDILPPIDEYEDEIMATNTAEKDVDIQQSVLVNEPTVEVSPKIYEDEDEETKSWDKVEKE
jgi:hypothetical protein